MIAGRRRCWLLLHTQPPGMSKMSAAQFIMWLAEMKSAGLARSDAKCAEALGLSANSILAMKKNGCDRRTALACRALLHRMAPYGESE